MVKTTEKWFHSEKARFGASTNSGATNNAIAAGIRYHKRFYKTLGVYASLSLPDWKLYIEPWFRTAAYKMRSPDAVLRNGQAAIVIEVKKNWRDGRDVKLLEEYLPIVKSAFDVETYPLMVVGNVRGLAHDPLLSMGDIESALAWQLGQPTPTLLKPFT